MTIQEFADRVKTAKVKDLELIFRTTDGKTLEVGAMFYGVKTADGQPTHPQVGEEPTCVIIQTTVAAE
jgi:hypothetical protein